MQLSGPAQKLHQATAYMAARLRTRRQHRDRRKQVEGTHWKWANLWTKSKGRPSDLWESKEAAARDWEVLWKAQSRGSPVARADHALDDKAFQGSRLRLYETLAKAEGSALCQARMEKIGSQAFLYRWRVSYRKLYTTPICPCGKGDQTAVHLFVECTDERFRDLRAGCRI